MSVSLEIVLKNSSLSLRNILSSSSSFLTLSSEFAGTCYSNFGLETFSAINSFIINSFLYNSSLQYLSSFYNLFVSSSSAYLYIILVSTFVYLFIFSNSYFNAAMYLSSFSLFSNSIFLFLSYSNLESLIYSSKMLRLLDTALNFV